jgi:tetratricopeptide (TPR) repeat protein
MTPSQTKYAAWMYGSLLLLLPLTYPGLLGTSADLLPKRFALYAITALLCLVVIISKTHIRLPQNTLTRLAILYVLWNLLSLTWASNVFSGWVEVLQLLALLILFLIASNLQNYKHTLSLCATTAGFIVSTIGIAQYLGLGFEHILSVGLPSSTFIFRNILAAYLLGAIPLGIFSFFQSKAKSQQLFSLLSLTTMLLCLFYTRTRGAWLSLTLGCIVLVCLFCVVSPLRNELKRNIQMMWAEPIIRGFTIVCTICLIVGMLQPAQTSKEVIQQFDEQKSTSTAAIQSVFTPGSDRGRLDMWRHTLQMIMDHPILGVGLDNWEYQYPPYDQGSKITFNSEPVRPHNDPLWIASELGLIGLGIYLYLLLRAVKIAWKNLHQKDAQLQRLALTGLFGLTALFIYSLFSFPKEQPTSALLFWFFLAQLNGLETTAPTKPKRSIPILGLVICIYAFYLNQRNITFDQNYNLARAYEKQGQLSQAQQAISQALEAGSFDHRAHFLKAQYLQKTGKLDASVAAYQHALAIHPNYAHTHHNLGGVYAARGNFNQAIPAFQRALQIRPSYEQARLNLGNVYMATKQFDHAITAYEFILQHNPQSDQAYTNLGAAYLQQEQFAKAIPIFQKAIALRPQNVQAHNNLAYSYEQIGQIPKAIVAYQSLLKHWQGDTTYHQTIQDHLQTLQKTLGQP